MDKYEFMSCVIGVLREVDESDIEKCSDEMKMIIDKIVKNKKSIQKMKLDSLLVHNYELIK